MTPELSYLALVFGLFVVPKALQRFRLPSAITSLLLGVGCAAAGLFGHDPTLGLLATYGISALFLFAGLEVDIAELAGGKRALLLHLAVQVVILGLVTVAVRSLFGLEVRASILVALALLTPSAGFILDSLDSFGLSDKARFWTKSKVIAAELLALAALFVALQSTSALRLAGATAALVALISVIPLLFRLFAERIAPYAPRSEFAFLLMLAVLCAFATRKLGVYYLVGAFLVGLAARQFRERLPAISSERVLHAIEAFASVFAPFYFFKAGLGIPLQGMGWGALGMGVAFLAVLVPLRIGQVAVHQRLVLGEPFERGVRVGLSMTPTLVFSLVLAAILKERFDISPSLYGGLAIYAVGTTLLPGLLLRTPIPEYDAPHLDEVMARRLGTTPGHAPAAPEPQPAPEPQQKGA